MAFLHLSFLTTYFETNHISLCVDFLKCILELRMSCDCTGVIRDSIGLPGLWALWLCWVLTSDSIWRVRLKKEVSRWCLPDLGFVFHQAPNLQNLWTCHYCTEKGLWPNSHFSAAEIICDKNNTDGECLSYWHNLRYAVSSFILSSYSFELWSLSMSRKYRAA